MELEKTPVDIASGDIFLICSDGVTDGLSDQRIAEDLDARHKNLTPAQHLVAEAVKYSGKDNATALFVAVS